MGSTLTTNTVYDERTTSNTKWSEYPIGTIIDLKPFIYDKEKKIWKVKKGETTNISMKKLKIVTYNVWFSAYKKKERFAELMKISSSADVICLQEVTPTNITFMKELDWIQDDYELSDISGNSVIPYGVCILSKIPIEKLTIKILPTKMCRMSLSAHLHINNERVIISTVHLESLNHPKERFEQLKSIIDSLKENSTNLIMGDFNFDSQKNYHSDTTTKNLENDNLSQFKEYNDIWAILNDDPSSGKTFDNQLNDMLSGRDHIEVMRYDRILIKSQHWKPTFIEMIGNKGFAKDEELGKMIFPSDHFGLMTVIEYQ